MKKILTILILVSGAVNSQPWIEQVSGVTVQLTGVSAIDYSNAWVCGYSGTVLRTTNVGNNWLNVSGNGIPATVQLINIFGINQTTALTAGYIGSNTWVYRTTNAGANWTQVFAQTGGFINAVHIRLDGTGFMMGDPVGGRWSLWKTTNSGVTWDSAGLYLPQAGAEAGYNNCLSVAGNRIWFGTNNSRIYNTTDNGASWTIQSTAPEADITSIWFDENGNSTGFCGGNNVLKTTNYGVNWASIGGLGTGIITGITSLVMWSGNIWYIRSGSAVIYWGNGSGQFMVDYTAPAGTYRHITSDRIPNFPYLGYAVRTNGGISHKQIFVQGLQKINNGIPEKFTLFQNYPNPFNPTTRIKFEISNSKLAIANLVVFDILGREIATLVDEQLSPGTYEVNWDASDKPSGMYYYRLNAADYSETKKMILIK